MKLKIENFNHLGILQEILRKMIEELEKVSDSSNVSRIKLEVCEGVLKTLNAGWITDEFPDVVEIEFGEEEEEVIEEVLEEDARLKLANWTTSVSEPLPSSKAIWPGGDR